MDLPTYEATDVDQGADDASQDTLTWSLTGADAGKFNIDNQAGGTPGQLTFKAHAGLRVSRGRGRGQRLQGDGGRQ